MQTPLDFAIQEPEPMDTEAYLRQHTLSVVLWPHAWRTADVGPPLEWSRVEFGKDTIADVPTVRGIYALSINIKRTMMPQHGILVYFGQTSRTLRKRYEEYIRESIRGAKRRRLRRLFARWRSDMDFFYAPIIDTSQDLRTIEMSLNDAVIPYGVVRDFSAEIRDIVEILRG